MVLVAGALAGPGGWLATPIRRLRHPLVRTLSTFESQRIPCCPEPQRRARQAPLNRSRATRTPYSTSRTAPEEMAEPTGLIAKSGIELLTFATPNGYKASILLEELKEAYGLEYTWQAINISKNTQKQPWFTAINPNGRIPAVVDHDRADFAVFEGNAILSYLTRHYDKEHKFSFPIDSDDYTVAEEWIGWQHGGLGPMQGQANHFYRFAPEKIPYATQRYVGEAERLYGILDARLAERDYVAGAGRGRYSIADVAMLGWANSARYSGVDLAGRFPHVRAWFDRCTARPATARGLAIPFASRNTNAAVERRMAEPGEERDKEEAARAFLAEAQEKYHYKYTSP